MAIPTLPKQFNFLGFQSTHSEINPKHKSALRILREHWDEEDAMQWAESRLPKPMPMVNHVPQLTKLPHLGGWLRLRDLQPSEPTGWVVIDTESSKHFGIWVPLCAVATNGVDWWIWLPDASGQATDKQIPFSGHAIAHNLMYDLSVLNGAQGGLCTMQMAASLVGGNSSMVCMASANGSVPWRNCLPIYNSLQALAGFCQVSMHSKETRNLCVELDWVTNYRENLLQILNYCIADTAVTQQVFCKIYPKFRGADPNPLSVIGLVEMSRFKLPLDPNFRSWLHESQQFLDLADRGWETKIITAMQTIKPRDWAIARMVETLDMNFDLAFPHRWLAYKKITKTGRVSFAKTRQINLVYSTLSLALKALRDEIIGLIGPLSEAVNPYTGKSALEPRWCKRIYPSPTCNQLPEFLDATYLKTPVRYDHPRFNIMGDDGELAGTWHKDGVSLAAFESPHLDLTAYGEYAREVGPATKMRERLSGMAIHNDQWVPSMHLSGTITQRLTDNIVLVCPKHHKTKPRTELLGMFKTLPNELFAFFDYSGQETMIFQALADRQVLGSSGYGKAVLEGDMHTIIRDILGFEKTSKGRSQAKEYTFLLQFGGGVSGCTTYLRLAGYSPAAAREKAFNLVESYVGSVNYSKGMAYYSGGLASEGYNVLTRMISQPNLKSLLFGRLAPLPLQKGTTSDSFMLTRKNWPIQSTGTDFARGSFAIAAYLAAKTETYLRPAVCIHDMPAWITSVADAERTTKLLEATHLVLTSMLYRNLGYPEMPAKFAVPDDLSVDNRLRLNALDPMETPSNVGGFPVESCLIK
jgi:hypothetical protein